MVHFSGGLTASILSPIEDVEACMRNETIMESTSSISGTTCFIRGKDISYLEAYLPQED